MSLDDFIKSADYIHICPFCSNPLEAISHKGYENHGMKPYSCSKCYIPGAETISGAPFSQYMLGVIENFESGDQKFDQVIADRTFYLHVKDNTWYNVHDNLAKQQTTVVLVRPTTKEDFLYLGEKPAGLIWVSELVLLPLITTWNLTDQKATLAKLKTYLLFS